MNSNTVFGVAAGVLMTLLAGFGLLGWHTENDVRKRVDHTVSTMVQRICFVAVRYRQSNEALDTMKDEIEKIVAYTNDVEQRNSRRANFMFENMPTYLGPVDLGLVYSRRSLESYRDGLVECSREVLGAKHS